MYLQEMVSWLFFPAWIAAIVATVALRRKFWRVPPPEWSRNQAVSLYELAYLRGGKRLIADAAIARLVESGALRVRRDGSLRATGAPGETELDDAILESVTSRAASVGKVRAAAVAHYFTEQVRTLVFDRRFVYAEKFWQKLLVLLPLLTLLTIGIVHFVESQKYADEEYDTYGTTELSGMPIPGLLLAIAVFVTLLVMLKMPEKYVSTEAGADLLRRIEEFDLTGAAGLVVQGDGLTAFPNPAIAKALSAAEGSRRSSSSSSSSCGDLFGGCALDIF